MFVLVSFALAAPCPPPGRDHPTLAADGAAHVLAADAAVACWWIVDDGGDPRVAARWDRARRDPVALVALADGRAVVVLVEESGSGAYARPRVRLAVRAEGSGERRLPFDLPGVPTRIEAHPTSPLVVLAWDDATWVVDVDAMTVTREPEEAPTAGGPGARR